MVAAYYPDWHHQVAWSADPNDIQGVETFADVTDMVRSIDRMPRGQQYELATARVQDSMVTFRDPDEQLNPANTASPLYPYVQPYRRMITQAVWPKGPGADSNLLNLNNWRVPADGSFESYAVGELPGFITESATVTGPEVTAIDPQAGTRSLTWTVATASTRQGVAWKVPCVPGQQYTTSAYVRQSSASTQILRISDQVLTNDRFNRTTAAGWGSAAAPLALGGAWSNAVGGAAADRSTVMATPYAEAYATMSITALSSRRIQTQPTAARDVRQRVRFTVPDVVTGAGTAYLTTGVVARYTDANNHYYCELRFGDDLSAKILLFKRVAGVLTQLGSAITLSGVTVQPGDQFYLDFYLLADILRAAAWRVDAPVVDVETDPMIQITDTAITASGLCGCIYELVGATNPLPYRVLTLGYSAVGSVEGGSTAVTGSYVRLSVTFTATAPRHTATVITTAGSAVAGTVNVDSIMHNTGAAAGTFTATGSVVYPVNARHIERFPRSYEQAGFVGICKAPSVDALAALAAIELPSDYAYALASTGPDYWWTLGGGENSTLYPDSTGNGRPPLGLNISKYGVGTLPSGGAAMSIPGGAGQTGVTFTPPSSPSGSTLAATVLGLGVLSESRETSFVVPEVIPAAGSGGTWHLSVAVWVRVADNGVSQSAFYPSKQLSSTAGQALVPLYMNIDGSFVFSNVGPTGTIHLLSSGTGLSGINVTDGEPHLLVGIVTQSDGGDTIIYRYIDDVLDGVNNATTASLGGMLRGKTDSLSVGATDDGASFLAVVNGSMRDLAVWNRDLLVPEATRLWQAGQGFPGETSTDRVVRHFESAGFYGPSRVDETYTFANVQPGDPVTTMQAPSWTGSIDLLTDTINTVGAEQGKLWAAPDGFVTVEGRVQRYLRLTPDWTLGEDTAAGEIPYAGTIGFDFDPTFVYGDVTVQRPGGATATGGLAADIAMTNRRYFPRKFGASGDFETDQQAQDCADWIFYGHRAPNMRVESVTLTPAANPDLWHFALSVEVGQRIRVIRRAKSADGGAGLTMSADYFVENVNPRDLDFERGTYFVDLELSPVGTGPGPTVQPWILEDATLGVLDSTTTLGW